MALVLSCQGMSIDITSSAWMTLGFPKVLPGDACSPGTSTDPQDSDTPVLLSEGPRGHLGVHELAGTFAV